MSKVFPVIGAGNEGHDFVFMCPACKILHAFDDVKWKYNGDLESPTLSPSYLVKYNVMPEGEWVSVICHSFIREGKIEFLQDCWHDFKGKTLDLLEIS